MRNSLALMFALLLAAAALAAPGLTADQAGNLYQYWLSTAEAPVLYCAKSLDQGMTFGPARSVYLFTQEVTTCDLKIGEKAKYYLAFGTSREAFFTWSSDQGKTFAPPLRITAEAYYPTIAGDNLGMVHLAFVTEDKKLGRQRLCYAATREPQLPAAPPSFEPVVIAESYDKLVQPKLTVTPWGIMITWQKSSPLHSENFLTVSLDGGRHFSEPRILPGQTGVSELAYSAGRWLAYQTGPRLSVRTVDFAPAPTPLLSGLTIRPNSIEVNYRTNSSDPLIGKIELSWYQDFPPDKTWTFEHLTLPGSAETRYALPVDLPDGQYYLRLSAFDGLTTSLPTDSKSLTIDRTPPAITLTAPTGEVSEEQNLLLAGRLSERARLTLNGRALTPEADSRFQAALTLLPGKNRLSLVATDEAGNTAALSKEVVYLGLRPEITVSKPGANDWSRPGSVIYIEAGVHDLQNDIEDESEALIIIAGQKQEDKLVYDITEGKLSGFIKLPPALPDGRLAAQLQLSDAAGNIGEKTFTINLDQQPPLVAVGSGETWFSNSATRLDLPLSDSGAGIDRMGTLVRIGGISAEALASAESGLALRPWSALPDGTYEVEVVPRDAIGNSGPACRFWLVVDTIAPALKLLSSGEAAAGADRAVVEAEVADNNLAAVRLYNNNHLVESFRPADRTFKREVMLMPGANELLVEAVDRAGNLTSTRLTRYSSARSSAALVTKFGNAPSPFSPARGETMYFTYELGGPADLKFYVFDLSGTLIWKRAVSAAGSGSLAWSGVDQFGAVAPNGVYPYIIQAAASGVIEICRGKIIIF